jgi:hypothetical protein
VNTQPPAKRGPGRPKGRRNNYTLNMHEMWMRAFDILGGVNFIVEKANSPFLAERVAIINGFARQIPLTVKDDRAPLTVNVFTQLGTVVERDIPAHGTCTPAETAARTPMPAPITVKVDDVADAEEIER